MQFDKYAKKFKAAKIAAGTTERNQALDGHNGNDDFEYIGYGSSWFNESGRDDDASATVVSDPREEFFRYLHDPLASQQGVRIPFYKGPTTQANKLVGCLSS
jgi:hypothetical protein